MPATPFVNGGGAKVAVTFVLRTIAVSPSGGGKARPNEGKMFPRGKS